VGWHLVEEGDCVASIAEEHGLTAEAIWDDPANAELKASRPSPNVLARGDAVFLPERKVTPHTVGGDARHRFRVKSALIELRVKLAEDDKPLAGLEYRLEVEGKFYPPTGDAKTDGSGFVVQKVPASAKSGTLVLPTLGRRMELRIGHLEPPSEERGLRARLRNLGLLTEGEDEAAMREAVAAFQAANGLESSGVVDDATRDKLTAVHGS
jgi:N-acetylmuramoyl-L-alanine amidase